ncbi:hypothetical protein [Leptospira borgpetersenii]|uniref:Uncharacterized protein n=2 Tax=Leptospira borgpetersenii serovar Hardjo-bovis TaxID=338217 RepID=Q04RM2_LEPBJ|nr:hypothetical protein [Leptospira borgpetersenii]ABJ76448.1 Hypothetical protein LBJ_1930 [Leptospira borgpetersenii serovar Hardjo-bovis str. JB197]ABJ78846.1 Hypothetical protein LBL_1354 [Leptospira borgpetersenii serovar Hardjo-bovis str. L550]AMX58123.1 hypothetical protein LBK6_07140 [Leptospira borgpetersenii serovar Hardjo]AMX61375.1 hypothetical protein LBK9_07155 [Leptospira borgpetersenii serovar Hardjo]AMX64620.1 hypothetical protein LBK30_07220 [Leptospira borgpetersenii serovar
MTFTPDKIQAKNYLTVIQELANYSSTSDTSRILERLSVLQVHDQDSRTAVLEASEGKNLPDRLVEIIKLFRIIHSKRQEIHSFYETAISKYGTINTLTAKRKPTDDEARIKQILTDYILKIESFFEKNDIGDEALIKEINRFLNELESLNLLNEDNLTALILSSKAVSLIQPPMEKLASCYQDYDKIEVILKRLVRIAEMIIEDAKVPR